MELDFRYCIPVVETTSNVYQFYIIKAWVNKNCCGQMGVIPFINAFISSFLDFIINKRSFYYGLF